MDPKPLAHKTALIACSEMKAQRLASGLEALGAEIVVFPVIEIRETVDKSALDAALDRIRDYSWIIFTSAYGARFFLNRMQTRGIAPDRLRPVPVCAIGPATAEILANSGVDVALVPDEFVAEGLLAALAARHGGRSGLAGLRILLPRAREARDLLPHALENCGAHVDVIPCYENALPAVRPEKVESVLEHPPDLIVFTSSSTVTNWIALLGDRGKQLLAGATIAALGPITARTITALVKQPEIVPDESTIPSLLAAIRAYHKR